MTHCLRIRTIVAAFVIAFVMPAVGVAGPRAREAARSDGPAGFQVRNHDIYGPDGKRFFVHGVVGFNDAFATFGQYWHEDWSYRSPKVPANGISPPAGGLRNDYVNHDFALKELRAMKAYGANLVRIFVEPAMFHSASYTDKQTGQTFPPEPQLLDDVIASAASLHMVVQLQPGEDNLPDAKLARFLGRLGNRYRDQWNVWLNTSNEPYAKGQWNPNGTETRPNPHLHDEHAWAERIGGALSAIRTAGFRNPVVVGPMNLWRIDNVISDLHKAPFADDPNLILGPHIYNVNTGIVRFDVTYQRQFQPGVDAFKDQYAIIIDEFGYDNGPNPLPPRVKDFAFSQWVPAAFKWLSDPAYDGITLFVWPPAYNKVESLVEDGSSSTPTEWGELARKGYALVGQGNESVAPSKESK